MASSAVRAEKVKRIFELFDSNRDGGLDRQEMAALVVAVNPRVKFSEEQINAILVEVFRTYADFIHPDHGLTLEGLVRTYDDGAGDVDRDFDALGLDHFSAAPAVVPNMLDQSSASSIVEVAPKQPRQVDAIVFEETWRLVDDLELLIKRLHAKQTGKDAKLKGISGAGDNSVESFSDAGWSRELGPPDPSEKRIFWEESGPNYAIFSKELELLRSRANNSRTMEAALDAHMAMGRCLYEHQLFNDSLVSFRRACELQPMDARPHFREGNANYAIGNHSAAKEKFLLALEAAEASTDQWVYLLPQIHVNLGITLETDGMLLGACEHYREAAVLCPTHFRALKLLGCALFGVGEYRAAEKALEEAIYLSPDYADAHCDLGSALHALGDDERAIQEFQKAIDLKPGHVDALYNLGGLYMDVGRFARASEMYGRVLAVHPNHWRAQLNKAVSLLGAGENEEARRAFRDAFRMTKRVEIYDSIAHLKMLHKRKSQHKGVSERVYSGYLTVEPSKFMTVGRKTTSRQELADAMQIRAFQRMARLNHCDVDTLRQHMVETQVPTSYSGSGLPHKSIRKAALEVVLRRMLSFLQPETFQGAVKAINQKVLSVLDASGSGSVDFATFFATLAPICGGPIDRRKHTAYDALLLKPHNGGSGANQVSRADALSYIKVLRAIYIPSLGVSEMREFHGESDPSTVSFSQFLDMFDDVDWGFGILGTLVKLEAGDRIRHGHYTCSVCRFPIIGSRFKEIRLNFSLCNLCYSEGKVPYTDKVEDYTFREYGTEAEAMKDKCTCFNLRSKNS